MPKNCDFSCVNDITRFNVRVYGIFIEHKPFPRFLVADELRFGQKMTKFPGGGLEFGEGIEDALKRELSEELNIEVSLGKLFYINTFFQQSAFHKQEQIISIYYLVNTEMDLEPKVSGIPFDWVNDTADALSFRWLPLIRGSENQLSFPIDKIVGKMLIDITLST